MCPCIADSTARRRRLPAFVLGLLIQTAAATPPGAPADQPWSWVQAGGDRSVAAPGVRPTGMRVLRDLAYGDDRRQRFDVYIPDGASTAPVIVMVHGGAWAVGDKGAAAVVAAKVARWLARGFIFVSVNYRMLPDADPLTQARDVAGALAAAQALAPGWGGDQSRFVLMGHSAGAHLVALMASAPAVAAGPTPVSWLGTVALDSAALDVERIMSSRHPRLYDRAFGGDPAYWRAASPYAAVTAPAPPFLLVCSTRRADSCLQAERFAARAEGLGVRSQVLPEDLSHLEINRRLGEDSAYTEAVESFLASLDPALAARLRPRH